MSHKVIKVNDSLHEKLMKRSKELGCFLGDYVEFWLEKSLKTNDMKYDDLIQKIGLVLPTKKVDADEYSLRYLDFIEKENSNIIYVSVDNDLLKELCIKIVAEKGKFKGIPINNHFYLELNENTKRKSGNLNSNCRINFIKNDNGEKVDVEYFLPENKNYFIPPTYMKGIIKFIGFSRLYGTPIFEIDKLNLEENETIEEAMSTGILDLDKNLYETNFKVITKGIQDHLVNVESKNIYHEVLTKKGVLNENVNINENEIIDEIIKKIITNANSNTLNFITSSKTPYYILNFDSNDEIDTNLDMNRKLIMRIKNMINYILVYGRIKPANTILINPILTYFFDFNGNIQKEKIDMINNQEYEKASLLHDKQKELLFKRLNLYGKFLDLNVITDFSVPIDEIFIFNKTEFHEPGIKFLYKENGFDNFKHSIVDLGFLPNKQYTKIKIDFDSYIKVLNKSNISVFEKCENSGEKNEFNNSILLATSFNNKDLDNSLLELNKNLYRIIINSKVDDTNYSKIKTIIVNANIGQSILDFVNYQPPLSSNHQLNTPYPIGNIDGIDIYVDPHMRWDDLIVFSPNIKYNFNVKSLNIVAEKTMAPKVYAKIEYNSEGEIFKLNHIELLTFLNIKNDKEIGLNELIKNIKRTSLLYDYNFTINDTILIEEKYNEIKQKINS